LIILKKIKADYPVVPPIGRITPFHKQAYGFTAFPENIQRPGLQSNGHSSKKRKEKIVHKYISLHKEMFIPSIVIAAVESQFLPV